METTVKEAKDYLLQIRLLDTQIDCIDGVQYMYQE